MTQQRYFKLIEASGTAGKYQFGFLIVWCVIIYLAGSQTLSQVFFFYKPPYDQCPHNKKQCENYVCTLDPSERVKFMADKYHLNTFTSSLPGDANCQKKQSFTIIKSLYYFGRATGHLVGSSISDNVGRKPVFIVGLLLNAFGIVLWLLFSQSYVTVSIGSFIQGVAILSTYFLAHTTINQITAHNLREKYVFVSYSFFGLSFVLNALWFYLFKDLKVVLILFYLLPTIVCTLLIILFLQQTPQYLVKKYGENEIIDSLRKISIANENEEIFNRKEQDLRQTIRQLKLRSALQFERQQKQIFSIKDLFWYPSLRCITICIIFIFIIQDFIYYGPNFIIDAFGLGIYQNAVIMGLSEVAGYLVCFCFIKGHKRKPFASFMYVACFGSAFVLFLLVHRVIVSQGFKIFMAFLFRFFVCFNWGIINIYKLELFPLQVGSLGNSIGKIVSTPLTSLLPFFFNWTHTKHLPTNLMFAVSCIFGLIIFNLLPETEGRPPREEIEELARQVDDQDKADKDEM